MAGSFLKVEKVKNPISCATLSVAPGSEIGFESQKLYEYQKITTENTRKLHEKWLQNT